MSYLINRRMNIKRKKFNGIRIRKNVFKKVLISIIFYFFGRGLVSTIRLDKKAKKEAENWRKGFTIMMKVAPKGPYMLVGKRDGEIKCLGRREVKNADIRIYFKNTEAAFLVLTGQLGISKAAAQHRLYTNGDLFVTMSVVRVMSLTMSYLFPSFILKKIFYRIPKRGRSSLRIYIATIFGI